MSKLLDLAFVLHAKTMEKKINWDIVDDSSIITNIGVNSVLVNKIYDDHQGYYFDIVVRNMSGNTVDEESFFQNETVYRSISEMMVRAKRDSLQADETLDEIMEKVSRL